MTLNSTMIQPFHAPQQQPFSSTPPPAPLKLPELEKITTVSFTAQFDSEYKAMEFARIMLAQIQHYGD